MRRPPMEEHPSPLGRDVPDDDSLEEIEIGSSSTVIGITELPETVQSDEGKVAQQVTQEVALRGNHQGQHREEGDGHLVSPPEEDLSQDEKECAICLELDGGASGKYNSRWAASTTLARPNPP